MSLESARDFLKKIDADPALKERLEAAPDLEARQRIIRAAGFDFTWQEFKEALEEQATSMEQDLTQDELEGVTGGRGGCACKGPHFNYLKL